VLIIVVSCTAVFFLLRVRDPSDNDRAYRDRHRSRRHQHQTVPFTSYNYDTPANPQSLQGKLAGMFRLGGNEHGSRNVNGRASGGGWVRAGSDEWDYDSGVEAGRGRGMKDLREWKPPGQSVASSSIATRSEPIDMPFIPPTSTSYPSMDSTSTVRLDLHGAGPSYNDPFIDSRPRPHSVYPVIHSARLSSGSPTPTSSPSRRTISPEALYETNDQNDREGRKRSDESEVSLRTFTGGTKFIESL
jgi:hypothetical protein